MSKLFSVLIAAAFITPAFAADAPPPAAKPEMKVADASGQLVTPQSDAAALKAAIEKLRAEAKGKTPEKQPEAKK